MRVLKAFAVAFCVASALSAGAQTGGWQPSPGHRQIPIWPGTAPDARPFTGPDTVRTDTVNLVAGRPYLYINNVSRPTMTVYSPKGRNTGVAVVVFPGGGYQILAIDLEGTEVCDWLTAHGITCVLLKYRVPGESRYPLSGPYPDSPLALQDAQRTVGLVRNHAAEWGIDPHKIGVLGFSAGGSLAAQISTHYEKRLYPVVDAADRVSCRPDFAAAIYPGHLSWSDTRLEMNPNDPVTRETPPTFLVQAEDDHVDGVNQALVYFIALKDAGVPAEMHLYAQGGHAFGLRPTKLPITRWPELMETWLHTIGALPRD